MAKFEALYAAKVCDLFHSAKVAEDTVEEFYDEEYATETCIAEPEVVEGTSQSNNQSFAQYKKLMNVVASQLLKDSRNFKMFEDGFEKDFDVSESFEL